MKKTKTGIFTLTTFFFFGILLTSTTPVLAETMKSPESIGADFGDDVLSPPTSHAQSEIWGKLTKEQKIILHKAIKAAKDKGASRKEIRELKHKYFDEWGIEYNKKLPKGFWKQLTANQRKELREGIKKLRDAGASRKIIKAYKIRKLKEWGIID